MIIIDQVYMLNRFVNEKVYIYIYQIFKNHFKKRVKSGWMGSWLPKSNSQGWTQLPVTTNHDSPYQSTRENVHCDWGLERNIVGYHNSHQVLILSRNYKLNSLLQKIKLRDIYLILCKIEILISIDTNITIKKHNIVLKYLLVSIEQHQPIYT